MKSVSIHIHVDESKKDEMQVNLQVQAHVDL